MSERKAIIFGGSSGIGEASARALLVKGRTVTITGRDEAKLAKAVQRLSAHGGVRAVVADALNHTAVEHAFDVSGPVNDVVICVSGE